MFTTLHLRIVVPSHPFQSSSASLPGFCNVHQCYQNSQKALVVKSRLEAGASAAASRLAFFGRLMPCRLLPSIKRWLRRHVA